MAIFSRRTVDRMLMENAAFSTEDQMDHAIARLNSTGFQALDAEWELAVLNAFDKVGGDVAHSRALCTSPAGSFLVKLLAMNSRRQP